MLRAPFKYEQLPSQYSHIRLVELQAGENPSTLMCRLHVVALSQAPSYEAVSYVWGNPRDKVDLIVNGCLIGVPPSLQSALARFRWPNRNRMLWADAVCINQEDLEERSRQVRIMREIFKGARTVLAWLGSEKLEDKEAIPLITLLERTAREVLGSSPEERRDKALAITRLPDDSYLKDLPPLDGSCWPALRRFFDRPYFSRAWVIREVNNMRSVKLLYGAEEMDFEIVACAARLFFDVVTYRTGPTTCLASNGLQNVIRLPLYDLRKLSLQDTLRFGRRFDAADPRDKIYAVFNWYTNSYEVPQFVPDYSMTVAQVYQGLAQLIMNETANLSVLQHVHHDIALDASAPTWVPQWNLKKWTSIIGRYNPRLRSCGVMTHVITTPTDGLLKARGIRVGEVSAHERPQAWEELAITESITNLHAKICGIYLQLRTNDANDGFMAKTVTVFTMTLVSGFDFSKLKDASLDLSKHNADAAAFMLRILQLSPKHSLLYAHANQRPACLHKLIEDASNGSWKDFEAGFKNFHDGRILFETKHGEYGVGPEITKTGDQIWVLFGSTVPFLLRPKDGNFQVIGECYIEEFMEGQAVIQMEEGGLLAEDIQLC
jgi:hypothetical protein